MTASDFSLEGLRLPWAFNSATIMHVPWEEELALWQTYGWRRAEIWASKLKPALEKGHTLEALRRQMSDAGVQPVGFCAGVITASRDEQTRRQERDAVRALLEMAAAMGSPGLALVIVGQGTGDLAADYHYLTAVLTELAQDGKALGVCLQLEFLGGLPLNGTLGTGIELVQAVNHPNLKLLFDLCHYYTSASHLEELGQLLPAQMGMVHIDDSQRLPMERLTNEKRCFPGEGRINVPFMIRHLTQDFGYAGPLTVEIYDKDVWELEPHHVMQRTTLSLRRMEEQLRL